MKVFVAYGRVDTIKKVWQAHNKINKYYFCFENAESAALAESKTKQHKMFLDINWYHQFRMWEILQTKKTITFLNVTQIFLSSDPKHEIVPIYKLVIVEEGHRPLKKIFDLQNKIIWKPTLPKPQEM